MLRLVQEYLGGLGPAEQAGEDSADPAGGGAP